MSPPENLSADEPTHSRDLLNIIQLDMIAYFSVIET